MPLRWSSSTPVAQKHKPRVALSGKDNCSPSLRLDSVAASQLRRARRATQRRGASVRAVESEGHETQTSCLGASCSWQCSGTCTTTVRVRVLAHLDFKPRAVVVRRFT